MKRLVFLVLWSFPAFSQSADTPVFNSNRRFDRKYADSIVTVTRQRIAEIHSFPPSKRRDTVSLELNHFLGVLYRSTNFQPDSTLYLAESLKLQAEKQHNLKYRLKAVLLLEYYYRVTARDFPKAMQLNYEALRIIREGGPEEKVNLWKVESNLGKLNQRAGRYDQAVLYFQQALQNIEAYERASSGQWAELYQSLGAVHNIMKQYEKSLAYYRQALAQVHENGSALNLAYLHADIGITEKDLGRYSEALKNLQHSAALWKSLGGQTGFASALVEIAEIHVLTKNYKAAETEAKEAISIGSSIPTVLSKAYAVLLKVYEYAGDYQNAFRYQQFLVRLADSTRESSRIQSMMQSQLDMEKELQDQRYLGLQRQEEINRIRQQSEKTELLKTIKQNELLKQMEMDKLVYESVKADARSRNIIDGLQIRELNYQVEAASRKRNYLTFGLAVISLFGIVLFLLNHKLRGKNSLLKQKNSEIEEALLRGQYLERKRVANELHDNVNSILASVKVGVESFSPLLPKDVKVHQSVLNMLETATREVRQISHNMLPAELEKQGLPDALRGLVLRLNMGEKTSFELNLNGIAADFPLEVAFNLYTICLELCQNIQKHSRATQARIEFSVSERHFILFVSDNGTGFDKNEYAAGAGLKNIYHRAQTINAEVKIKSVGGEGTVVYLKMPLSQLNRT